MSITDISQVLLELGLSSSVTDEERAIVNTAIVRAEGAVKRFLKYDPVQKSHTEYYPQSQVNARNVKHNQAIWDANDTQAFVREVGQGQVSELQVQHLPIRSITELFVDFDGRSGSKSGAFAAETEKTEGTDFWANDDGLDDTGEGICRDGIIRSFGLWPLSPGTVKVVYVAGYTAAEFQGQESLVDASPIMDAVLEESVRRAKKAFVNMKQQGTGFSAGPLISERMGDYSYRLSEGTSKLLFGSTYDITPESQMKLQDFVNVGWPISS